MTRKLIQLLQASMIAALLPLTACLADEPEGDDEDIASVEGEIDLGVVEEGASGTEEDVEEAGGVDVGVPGLGSELPGLEDFAAVGQTMPGSDRMAEPIPYPSDDPPKESQIWPGDPSDPTPDQN